MPNLRPGWRKERRSPPYNTRAASCAHVKQHWAVLARLGGRKGKVPDARARAAHRVSAAVWRSTAGRPPRRATRRQPCRSAAMARNDGVPSSYPDGPSARLTRTAPQVRALHPCHVLERMLFVVRALGMQAPGRAQAGQAGERSGPAPPRRPAAALVNVNLWNLTFTLRCRADQRPHLWKSASAAHAASVPPPK